MCMPATQAVQKNEVVIEVDGNLVYCCVSLTKLDYCGGQCLVSQTGNPLGEAS